MQQWLLNVSQLRLSHKEAHLCEAVLQSWTFVAPATMWEHQAALKAVCYSPSLLQLHCLCRGLGVVIGTVALKLPCWEWQLGMALGAVRNCPGVRVIGWGGKLAQLPESETHQ